MRLGKDKPMGDYPESVSRSNDADTDNTYYLMIDRAFGKGMIREMYVRAVKREERWKRRIRAVIIGIKGRK